MINYRPPAYAPRLAQAVVGPAVVAPAPVVTSPVASATEGAPVPTGLFWTAVAGAAAWASIATATNPRSSTLLKVAGWVGGVGAGLGALLGLTGVVAPSTARTFPAFRWYWY